MANLRGVGGGSLQVMFAQVTILRILPFSARDEYMNQQSMTRGSSGSLLFVAALI